MNEKDLYVYQHKSHDHIIDHTHGALFLDMGLGKTVITLTAINNLIYDYLEIKNAIVIAPKRVADSVWDVEAQKWDHLKHLSFSKIQGNEKERRKALSTKADVYLIGRDNVAWLCGVYGGKMLPFDMCVIDELSSFKNPKSIRFKSLRMVQPTFKRVLGLTGTPAPNGLIDLWSQIYLLDRGERLGKFITHYRDKYFKPAKRNGAIIYSYTIVSDAEQEIHDKISDICISMRAKDYLDLPERINNVIEIKFTPEIQKKYDEFEEEQVLKLFSEHEITAVNAAALSNKLLQFANGAVYDEEKRFHVVHDLKIEAVKEIIEDNDGKPILIAWTYRHDCERLKEALKKYHPRELKTDEDIRDWNSGKIHILLMHPASGGHGLNLQFGGHIIIWFGQTWSVELEQQLNARLDRNGQKFPVIINKLVAVKTIDQDVIKAQERKTAKQESLMEAVKLRIDKYVKQVR